MNNPSGKKLEKLVFGMFDQMVEGSDKYATKQGSTWLIFTEDKRWVIEFTKDKTLWFNYNLFQSELELIGKNCSEEKDLIKNWFESRFLNTNGVRHTIADATIFTEAVEDTIQNGVKHTRGKLLTYPGVVEDTIQNGVKHTEGGDWLEQDERIDDIIENGVKETREVTFLNQMFIEETIQNGVKDGV
jgi:hypothetical protein